MSMEVIDKTMRALCMRQPLAQMILRGMKTFEYRRRRTTVSGCVSICAGLTRGDNTDFMKIKVKPGDLTTEIIVGSFEIEDCKVSRERRVQHE